MKVVSLQVGGPRQVEWKGEMVTTSIFKEPVHTRVVLRRHNLAGDEQSDLTVHGGPYKAVYGYASEHYPAWRAELPSRDLPYGMFGENLTTEGLLEDTVCIGDRFRIGTAELVVAQPRFPCYKLGIKFGTQKFLKTFLESGRSGFYFSILEEGAIGPGDTIERTHSDERGVTVADIVTLYRHGKDHPELMRRAAQVEALPESWRQRFME